MKHIKILVFLLFCSVALQAQNVQYLKAQPLSTTLNTSLKPVKNSSVLKIPLITWGGDIATILAETNGIFKQNGLNISTFREDDFKKQVQLCKNGDTPYLRGTMGMINVAADAFKNSGTELVVIYQLTWSVGGDAMVVRSGKSLNNINSVVLQLYGPHMDYAANLFKQSNRLNKVDFKWTSQLTLSNKVGGKAIDPVTAFQENNIDAVMCIIPDALLLTSNGNVGTGSEGSVKGSKILLSTKTASRIIADVYAVRKDYYDSHRLEVQKFVKSLMQAEEVLRDLKKSKQSKYQQLLSKSAEKLLGSSQFTADAEALLGDCEFVGYNGNISFFTGVGTTRNFKTLKSEIQTSFVSLGLMTSKAPLSIAKWNYTQMSSGLKYAKNTTTKPKFNQQKVAKKIEQQIQSESTTWADAGTLFVIEINFAPNQSNFTIGEYEGDFKKALEIAETNGGALVIIEGHSDPLGILKAEQQLRNNEPNHKSRPEIGQMKQRVKSLSLERAQTVRSNFLQYCKNRKINVDASQYLAVGMGDTSPKYSPPRTKEEWNANRRVVFRIKQVEAELEEFSPLN